MCFPLQGPLNKVRSGEENDDSRLWSTDYEGEVVSFLSLAKYSVLVIGWLSGQLQIDALADKITFFSSSSASDKFVFVFCRNHLVKYVAVRRKMILDCGVQIMKERL